MTPRRLRLALIGPSPCGQCTAVCCKQTVSEFAVLLQTDDERRRFAAWSITLPVRDAAGELRHERVIPYRQDAGAGRCPFLGDDDRCTIYEDRPRSCRDFECTRHFHQHGHGRHGLFLRGNPAVAHLLERAHAPAAAKTSTGFTENPSSRSDPADTSPVKVPTSR